MEWLLMIQQHSSHNQLMVQVSFQKFVLQMHHQHHQASLTMFIANSTIIIKQDNQ